MDYVDFELKPWDVEDPETGTKDICFEDKNIRRKMYMLENIYEKQMVEAKTNMKPNPNNWNFGSPPPNQKT